MFTPRDPGKKKASKYGLNLMLSSRVSVDSLVDKESANARFIRKDRKYVKNGKTSVNGSVESTDRTYITSLRLNNKKFMLQNDLLPRIQSVNELNAESALDDN